MLRRTGASGASATGILLAAFKPTAVRRVWTAEDGETGAHIPDTTFKNIRPNPFLRLWRQIRQRAWMLWSHDEEFMSLTQESFIAYTRMEQIVFFPTSSYGAVPGSYSDPVLYNTKSTSPFRWHSNSNNFDVAGHWYMEADEIFRLKDWAPKNPDDPFEMFPRPPNVNLGFEETIDDQGNRQFKYKYRYEFTDPHARCFSAYPFNHLYVGHVDNVDRVESYGFKQGELLRCNNEEESVLRRVMEEEDKEWDMIKRTELIQEPWFYPGKVRGKDLQGSLAAPRRAGRRRVPRGARRTRARTRTTTSCRPASRSSRATARAPSGGTCGPRTALRASRTTSSRWATSVCTARTTRTGPRRTSGRGKKHAAHSRHFDAQQNWGETQQPKTSMPLPTPTFSTYTIMITRKNFFHARRSQDKNNSKNDLGAVEYFYHQQDARGVWRDHLITRRCTLAEQYYMRAHAIRFRYAWERARPPQ